MFKSKQIDEAQKAAMADDRSQQNGNHLGEGRQHGARTDNLVTSLETAPPGVFTSKDTINGEGTSPEAKVELFRSRIEGALGKSVEAIIEAGQHLKAAKEALGASYSQLVAKLPISPSTAAYLIRIAENPVLRSQEHWARLPYSYNTLYQLALVDETRLVDCLDSGLITPEITLAKAKALRNVSPNATNGGGKSRKPTLLRTSMYRLCFQFPGLLIVSSS